MKRIVNGTEEELVGSDSVVIPTSDRLIVRHEGVRSTSVAVSHAGMTLVSYLGRTFRIEQLTARRKGAVKKHSGEVRAPMPGQVIGVFVSNGDQVVSGQKLISLEAMKTLQVFGAPFDGTVVGLNAVDGMQVAESELLLTVVASENQ